MSTRAKKYASKKRPARGSYSRAAKKYSMGFNRQAALTVRNPPRGLQLKTVDRDLGGGQPILNTGAVACFTLLNGCGEGASFYTRVGRRIAGKSLMLKLNLTATATALANQRAPIVRCLVIYDRQANGAYPADPVPAGLVAVSAVLQDITAAGGVAAPITVNYGAPNGNVLCGLNMNNTDRFLILADSVHSVANTANVGASTIDGKSACIWKYIALKNLETHFTTSNDDIAGISTGAIHLLMISDTADSIQFSLAARYRFSDLWVIFEEWNFFAMKRGRVGVKCIDTIQLGQVASLDVGGVGVCLNPFDLGTNFFECRSNRVKIVGIKLRCIVSPLNGETVVTANGVYTCGVQMQVVYDRQSNNPDPFIPPVLTEVFGSVYDGAGFADYLMALQGFPKPYAYQRFISLASQLFVIPTVLPISYEAPYVSDYEGYVVGRPKRYALQNSVEQCAVEKYSDHCAGGIKFGMQYPSINPSFNPLLVEPNQGDQDVVTMTYSEGNFDEQSSWKWVNRVESELEGASQLTGLSEFPAASGGLFLNYPDITVPDGLITDVNVSTTGGGIYSNVTGSGGGGGGGGTVAAGAGVILPALPDNPVTTTVLGTSTNVFSSTPSYADLTISSFAAHYDGSFGTEYTGGGICSIPAGFINDDTGRVLGPALWNRISLTDPSDGGSIPNFQVGIRGQMSASTSYYGRTVNFNIVYMDTFFGTYYCIYEFDPVDEIPESWIIPQDAIIELPEVVQPFPGDFSVLNLTGGRKVKVYSTNYYVESGTDVVVRDFTFLFSSIGDTVLAPEFLPVVCKYPDTYNPIRKEYDNLRLVNHYPVPVGGNALPFMVDPKGRSSWMMDEELDLDEDDLWCDLTGTNGDVPYSGGLWFYIYAGWQGSPDAPPLQYNLTARVFYDDS